MQNTIQSLFAAGGTDEQVFDKMYEAFTEKHILKFNQEMQVWKSVAESSSNPAKQPSTTTIYRKLASYTRSKVFSISGLNMFQALVAIIAEKGHERKI